MNPTRECPDTRRIRDTRVHPDRRIDGPPRVRRSAAVAAWRARFDLPRESGQRLTTIKSSHRRDPIDAFKDRLTGQDLCLHLTGGAKAISDGVAVVLFHCDGTRSNQQMYASPPDASGAISLMAAHSYRCLTVFGSLDSDLALLCQFGLYTGAASCTGVHQRWDLRTDQGAQYDWTLVAPEGWTAPACVL